MRKLRTWWVPRVLTDQQILEWAGVFLYNLDTFKRNLKEFLRHFVTLDETWIYHYTLETKEGSKRWVEAGGRGPKRSQKQQTAGKIMATIFWDVHGIIIHIDYLEKEKIITAQYNSKFLDWFDAAAYEAVKTMTKLSELKY